MTEEEAKTQPCIGPKNCGRVVQTGSLDPDNFPRFCVGSACKMAWRWEEGSFGTPRQKWSGKDMVPAEGYCGLAGRP